MNTYDPLRAIGRRQPPHVALRIQERTAPRAVLRWCT